MQEQARRRISGGFGCYHCLGANVVATADSRNIGASYMHGYSTSAIRAKPRDAKMM